MQVSEANEALDMISYMVVLGSVAQILPPIAATLAIIWTLIRIYEWVRFRILKQTDEAFK